MRHAERAADQADTRAREADRIISRWTTGLSLWVVAVVVAATTLIYQMSTLTAVVGHPTAMD